MDDDFWNKVSGISDDGDDEETFSEPGFSDDTDDAGGDEPYFPRESPMRRRRYAERAGYGEDDEPYRPRFYSEEAPQASAAPQPQQAPQPAADPAPVADQSQTSEPGKVLAGSLGVIAVCALLATGFVAVKNHQATQDAAPSVVVTECASPTTQAPATTPTPKPVETTTAAPTTQAATPTVSASPQPASPTDRATIDPDSLQFSEPKTVTGLVVSKSIMETGGNLMFTVHLSVPDSNRPTINYVVPKGQYDGYKSGDLIEVTYRVDQHGNIAIIR
jgi:hypothetical protein